LAFTDVWEKVSENVTGGFLFYSHRTYRFKLRTIDAISHKSRLDVFNKFNVVTEQNDQNDAIN